MIFLGLCFLAYWGGWVLERLRVPAGQMLGSVAVTAVVNILVMEVTYSPEVKFMSRILAGILIAMRIKREDVENLKQVLRPLIVLVLGMLAYTVGLAYFFDLVSEMEFKTALFACVPGGLTDISLMAEDYGANMPQVALVQTLRLMSIMLFFPGICLRIAKKTKGESLSLEMGRERKKLSFRISEAEVAQGVRSFVFAGLGGYALGCFGIPAGELLGAMGVTLYRKLSRDQGYFYPPLRVVVQVVVGIIVGARITQETIDSLIALFPVAVASTIFVLAFALGMGYALHRFFGVDLVTALLSCAPGGVQEMVLVTDSLGGDVSFVTSMQIFRLIAVLTIFPFVIQLMLRVTGA